MLATMLSTLVCKAASDYEEVGYEDLVRQISAKKKSYETKPEVQPFDQVMIHAGLGYVNSFSEMVVNNRNVQRYQNGMELSVGVDLFSDQWFAESSFRNFGVTNYGSEELILKELDLKIGYKNHLQKPFMFRIEGGLANRYLHISDSVQNYGADDTTPMLMGQAGLAAQLSPNISLGLDFSAKSTLVTHTADKSAFDFTFGIKASL
jgi:hypothetical protein